MREWDAGLVADPHDEAGDRGGARSTLWRRWESDGLPDQTEVRARALERYSRRANATQLAEVLEARGVAERLRVLVAGWLNSPHVRAWAELVSGAGHDVQLAGRFAPGWPELELPVRFAPPAGELAAAAARLRA